MSLQGSPKASYQAAQSAIRYLRTYYGDLPADARHLGHDYFLRKIAHLPVRIVAAAYAAVETR